MVRIYFPKFNRPLAPRGGTLIFSSYVGLGTASTVHPKKYQEFQAPPKNIWNFTKPKKYPPFCTLTLRKDLKMHRNDPNFVMIPQKYPQNLHTPKNIHFSENPQK